VYILFLSISAILAHLPKQRQTVRKPTEVHPGIVTSSPPFPPLHPGIVTSSPPFPPLHPGIVTSSLPFPPLHPGIVFCHTQCRSEGSCSYWIAQPSHNHSQGQARSSVGPHPSLSHPSLSHPSLSHHTLPGRTDPHSPATSCDPAPHPHPPTPPLLRSAPPSSSLHISYVSCNSSEIKRCLCSLPPVPLSATLLLSREGQSVF